MDMTPQEYQEYVKRLAPKSPIFKDTAFAFFIGGAICALGQLIQNGFLPRGPAWGQSPAAACPTPWRAPASATPAGLPAGNR